MLQLFKKNKLAIVVVAIVLLSTILVIASGVTITSSRRLQFPLDGYAIQYEDGTETGVVADQVRFASGSAVSASSIGSSSFLHFDDNSLSSFGGMTLVDLGDYADGLADSYYLGSRQILSSQDGIYGIDNNGTTLEFENFLLKTDEQTYLIISPSLSLTQKNGQVNNVTNGFVEINYLDEDDIAVRVTDGSNAWQFLTDGAVISLDNGTQLDLATKQLSSGVLNEETGEQSTTMSLSAITVDSGSNIQVTNNTADAWIAPTFIVNPVNGSDGESGSQGDDGEIGESGEDGEDGADGEIGATGEDGADGTHGANASNGTFGGNGQDGSNSSVSDNDEDDEEETTIQLTPCITISSWTQTAGSFAFSFTPYNTSMIQEGTLKATLYKVSTGKIVSGGSWSEAELTLGAELADGTEYTPGTAKISLEPETSYKLVFDAKVLKTVTVGDSVKTQAAYGKSILLTRMFTTDANGFYLEKVESEYFSSYSDRLACERKYAESMELLGVESLDTASSHAFLGLRPVISGSQTITGFSDVTITYVDADGKTVNSTDQRITNWETSAGECENLVELANQGLAYPLDNLLPDTEYTIRMTVEIDGSKTETFSETYHTLKSTPDVGYACFTINASGYFESYVDFKEYSDPDDAIAYYTHKVYLWDDETGAFALPEKAVKTKISYDAADPRVYFYLESANQNEDEDGSDKITVNKKYGTKIYVTWFDNEKYVTKEVQQSSGWQPAKIESTSQPKVFLTNVDTGLTSTSLTAKLVVQPNGDNSVSVGTDEQHRLHVQIASSNKTNIIYYTDLSDWYDVLEATPLTNNVIPSTGGYTTITLTNLAPSTRYTITVTGILDGSTSVGGDEGTAQKVQIGTTSFITKDKELQIGNGTD